MSIGQTSWRHSWPFFSLLTFASNVKNMFSVASLIFPHLVLPFALVCWMTKATEVRDWQLLWRHIGLDNTLAYWGGGSRGRELNHGFKGTNLWSNLAQGCYCSRCWNSDSTDSANNFLQHRKTLHSFWKLQHSKFQNWVVFLWCERFKSY